MSRDDTDRLDDIHAACDAIRTHLARSDLADGTVFDAVRMRLVEIGEAVKGISPNLLASEPDIPWHEIAAMRDRLAHHYFDTVHSIVATTATSDLAELETAARRLRARIGDDQ
jgi:uncharacterized protein with HEPN domain